MDLFVLKKLEVLLEEGLRDGVYPGAVLLVASGSHRIYTGAVGHAAISPVTLPMSMETIFDLASLTKPLSTCLAVMKMVEEGMVKLDEPLAHLLKGELPKDKREITMRQLLSHVSGLPDWAPFFARLDGVPPGDRKRQVRNWITNMPLTFRPGSRTLYSDLGFMLLEWVIEKRTNMTLSQFLRMHFYDVLDLRYTFLYDRSASPYFESAAFAATEFCSWRNKMLQGVVHDENAYALGGYSGHAGLFGTAEEIYGLTRVLMNSYSGKGDSLLKPETVRTFFARQRGFPDNATWALGWDTPSRIHSSAGRYFSTNSVGHLGFTGTSLWMDLERKVTVILLTNRIHPTRKNEKIRIFRPRLHDSVMEALGHGN